MKVINYIVRIFLVFIAHTSFAYSQENTILHVDSFSLRNSYLEEMQSIDILKHKPIEVSEELVRSVLDKQAAFAVYKDNYMVTGIPRNKFINPNLHTSLSYKVSKNSNQYLTLDYYAGYGEGLLNYKKYTNQIRIGFTIKPDFFSAY